MRARVPVYFDRWLCIPVVSTLSLRKHFQLFSVYMHDLVHRFALY